MKQEPCRLTEIRTVLPVFQYVTGDCAIFRLNAPAASVADQQRSVRTTCYNIDFESDNRVVIQRQIACRFDLGRSTRSSVGMTPGLHCFSNIQASSEWVNISGGAHQFKTLNFRSTRRPRDAMSVQWIQFIKAKKQRRPEGRQSQFISIP
jgi:hypothetical protein